MNVLPHASATGNIHIGTIAGKLNGVMPAHTPTGWRSEKLSTPVPTLSLNSPLSRCGMPVANSTTSMPRVIEPSASADRLAVLLRHQPRQVGLVRFHQLAKAHQNARAAQRRRGAPRGQCSGRGGGRGVDVGGVAQRNVPEHFAGRGIGHLAVARRMRGDCPAADPQRQALECRQVHGFSPAAFGRISAGVLQPRDVARDHVDFEVDPRAGREASQRRHRQCMRDQIDRKAPARDRVDREAHAVDRDRALARDEARELGRRLDLEPTFSPSLAARSKRVTMPTPSTWPRPDGRRGGRRVAAPSPD